MTFTIAGRKVGHTGLGLMGLTWRETVTPDEQAFAAMRTAVDAGATLWSSAEVYGSEDDRLANLKLLGRYFAKHPEDAKRVVLAVKGGYNLKTLAPKSSAAQLRSSWERCSAALGPAKRIDVFIPGRRDRNVPVANMMAGLKALQDEGKIGAAGLSEVNAETLVAAHAVHPVALVEVELSLWTPDILRNGIAAAARERGVVVMAYSPLGRGFLTGQIKSVGDVPKGDVRALLDRFKPENLDKNLPLAEAITACAAQLDRTPAQLALAWVRAQGSAAAPVIPIPGATRKERVAENVSAPALWGDEHAKLNELIGGFEVSGQRYSNALAGHLDA